MGVEFQEFVSLLNLSDLDVNYLMDEMFYRYQAQEEKATAS